MTDFCDKDCYDPEYSAGRTVLIKDGKNFCPRCGKQIKPYEAI